LVIEKVLNMITDGELKVGDRLPSAQKLAEIKRKFLSIVLPPQNWIWNLRNFKTRSKQFFKPRFPGERPSLLKKYCIS
jgi:hypothetical protein